VAFVLFDAITYQVYARTMERLMPNTGEAR